MSTNTIEDFDLEDRAAGLVSIATKWDEIHTCLTGGGRWMTEQRAEQAELAMVRPFAHPLIGEDTLRELMHALRDAVNGRETYETYGFLPDHLDDKVGESYSTEQVADLLDGDIDAALFPLLTACSVPCHECKRVKRDVTFWFPATYGMRCEQHRLIVATHDGMGVGLVSS